MTTSVIVAGARTPVGKLMGSLKDFSASDLGAIAISGALEKAKVPPSLVEYVIMGQILTAGARADACAPGRGCRRHQLGRARDVDQQDVPVRNQRDRTR